ncbi:MAG: RNA-binding protein [Myxococcales bacterium]|nr:MAG: RNA-binding protein [Myxococcales bacterium]
MSKKLFVGSLAWATTSDTLRGAFASFGEIEDAVVINDRATGRSRGFGFVTFADDEAADKAVKELDGSELDGRTIRVNEAQAREAGGGGRGFGGGGGRSFGGGGGGGRGFGGGGGGGGFGGPDFPPSDRGGDRNRRGGGGGRDRGGKGSRRGGRGRDDDFGGGGSDW